MLKRVFAGALALVVALLAYAATRPDNFQVRRAASIKAPAERIHAQLQDFRNWATWSPYEKRDPAMRRTLAGAASGRGAVYSWDGNGEVGEGRMEITEASAERVVIALDFVRPLETRNVVEFSLEPAGDSTRVTWAMKGPSPYVSKLMGVFVDMDAMIGRDFEAGLADLKAVVEKSA